jgi:hypothetical protein
MDKRCFDCKLEENLMNLQVLRHVIAHHRVTRENTYIVHGIENSKDIDSDVHYPEPEDSSRGDLVRI